MNQAIAGIAKHFLNLLYPLHCAICKISLDPLDDFGLCEFCKGEIKQNPKPHCRSCGRSLRNALNLCAECQRRKFYFKNALSSTLYEGVLKDLIHLFKYKGKTSLAKILSRLMIDFIEENDEILDGVDMITFVPLQNKRLRERGFNQSKVLALNLSKVFGIPLSDRLEKTRSTAPQNELARADRLTNLSNAFRVKDGTEVRGLNILLIDDVMTTGATLNECSKTLVDYGVKEVRCLTLARGV